jgi:succinate dehydrogenase/fumarate reductase flavoprotein subunit
MNMKKSERQVEVLIESLIEVSLIEKVIESLPRGYISVKTISGHQYFYRQWREGNHIVSTYVPESYLNVVRQKIEIRKQNEQLLKILKKDYKKAEKAVLKVGEVSEEKIALAKEKVASLSEVELANRRDVVKSLKEELLA